MSHNIVAIKTIECPAEIRQMLAEYLSFEVGEIQKVCDLEIDIATLVADTMDHLDRYLPPHGRIYLAHSEDDALIGCIFLKFIRPDTAEIKRLYVRPAGRGKGLGRALAQRVLADARGLGAAHVLIDTRQKSTAARALYTQLGFYEIDAYPESENDPVLAPHLCYMQMDY